MNRQSHSKFIICIIFVFSLIFAKDYSSYISDNKYDSYLNYLLISEKIKVDFLLEQPYQINDILPQLSSLESKTANTNIKAYKDYIDRMNEGELKLNFDISLAYDHYLNGNLDYCGNIGIEYKWKGLGIKYQYNVDNIYLDNEEYSPGIGKLGYMVPGRASEAYIQWQNSNNLIFMGRMNKNLGFPYTDGLLLSDNAYSFDHISYTFHNNLIRFTTLFTRLNDLYSYDTRDTISASEWSTRFLSLHKVGVKPIENLEISFLEAMLYGGNDPYPQLQYLNPANIFFFSKMGERGGYDEKRANAFMGFEIVYNPINKIKLYTQILIDDIDFVKSLREIYPDRLGITLKLTYSDLAPNSLLSIDYNRISNWTYNSFYTFGNYTYYGMRIGYPYNGVENISLNFDYFNISKVFMNFHIIAERIREQDLDEGFPGEKSEFPYGIAEKKLITGLNIKWLPLRNLNIDLKINYNYYLNYNNVEDDNRSFISFMINLETDGFISLFKKQ